MTGDQYLRNVLAKYVVNEANVKSEVNRLYPVVQRWGGNMLLESIYSGSIAKGTAISLSTDADVFLSLSSSTTGTLRQIYDSLASYFQSSGYSPIRQNVSIGIRSNSFKIDWVPGRRQSQYGYDHSLYKRKTDSWTKTNVKTHVSTVSSSNRIDEIRLTKIWRDLHKLDFPSFYLELVVIDTLRYATYGNLATNFFRVLQFLASTKFPNSRYSDPSNTNNMVSDDLSYFEKVRVQSQAGISASKTQWGQIVW